MAVERTLAIIKPDAVKRGLTGDILSRIHAAKFQIVAIKSVQLSRTEAEGFYAVHSARPFFGELTEFMSSGKCVVMVLEAEGAIAKWRETMGATDPAKAAPGTIRKELGTSIQFNCTHGSDAPETAAFEIGYFFAGLELISPRLRRTKAKRPPSPRARCFSRPGGQRPRTCVCNTRLSVRSREIRLRSAVAKT